MAHLYSTQYGIWGNQGLHPGRPVKLTPERIRKTWLSPRHSRIVWATAFGQLIGYAIAVQTHISDYGMVSWVTQLVVHEEHRRSDVGKTLLFTIWQFTDHSAWGLITANPFAIRALEKATRRRCSPACIAEHRGVITSLGTSVVPYVKSATSTIITPYESRVNTSFFLDHSNLQEMLLSAEGPNKPWTMGPLQEGWEWFAFTFRNQQQIELSRRKLSKCFLHPTQLPSTLTLVWWASIHGRNTLSRRSDSQSTTARFIATARFWTLAVERPSRYWPCQTRYQSRRCRLSRIACLDCPEGRFFSFVKQRDIRACRLS